MDDDGGFTPKHARRATLSQTRATPQTQRRVTFADAPAPATAAPLPPTGDVHHDNDDEEEDNDAEFNGNHISEAPGDSIATSKPQAPTEETLSVDGEGTVSLVVVVLSSSLFIFFAHSLVERCSCRPDTGAQDRGRCLLIGDVRAAHSQRNRQSG